MKLKRINSVYYLTIDGVVLTFSTMKQALEKAWENR